MQVLTLVVAVCFFFASTRAYATPETWFDPAQTITGNASSQFGAAIACSTSAPNVNHSYIAVAAPQENSGEGRVYIVGPTGIVSTITPPIRGRTANFGYALTFARDINGDAIDELVVSEPNAAGFSDLHFFVSTGVPTQPYTLCVTWFISIRAFGTFLLTTSTSIVGGFELMVESLDRATIYPLLIRYAPPTCTVEHASRSDDKGAAGSRYGQSFGEVASGHGFSEPDMLVGAPLDASGAGSMTLASPYLLPPDFERISTPLLNGSPSSKTGVAVASRLDSAVFGFNAPAAAGGRDTIRLGTQTAAAYSELCTLSIPMADLPDTASHSLAHLQHLFKNFLSINTPGSTFASYRSEPTTGGSVGLFGAEDSGRCTGVKQVNNCAMDATQGQGYTLAGGTSCVTTGGAKMLVVGAPGFSSNAGRIDIYTEGSQFPVALPCGAARGRVRIPIDPNTTGLPAPHAIVTTKQLSLVAPQLISNSKNAKFEGYLFQVRRLSAAASVELQSIDEPGTEALDSTKTKKQELFSKRNRITLRNLGRGTYTVSYRPVFTLRKKTKTRRVVGKPSAQGTVTIN